MLCTISWPVPAVADLSHSHLKLLSMRPMVAVIPDELQLQIIQSRARLRPLLASYEAYLHGVYLPRVARTWQRSFTGIQMHS